MKELVLFVLLFTSAGSFAQQKNGPTLIDEFGTIPCDDFLARIDNFYNVINANSGSRGYFVISGGKELLERRLGFELLFETSVPQRSYDPSRATLIRGKETGPLQIKIWLVRPGVVKPDFGETKWDFRMEPGSTPFGLRSDMEQICDPSPIGHIAQELLDANPNGSIFVIVHGPTMAQRRKELKIARRMLSAFDESRIRYLLRRSHIPYSDYYFALGNPNRRDFKSYF